MSRRRTRTTNTRKKAKVDLIFGLIFIGVTVVLVQPEAIQALFSFLLPLIIILLFIFLFGYLLNRNRSRQVIVLNKIKTEPDIASLPQSRSFNDPQINPSHLLMEKKVTLSWTQELIGQLEWKRFEELCAGYFSAKGYRAEVSRQGADGGIDIFLFKSSYSETEVFGVVQCKAWNAYRVGVKPIRELFGVKTAEKAPLGVFITSGEYTREALEFAEGKSLKLLTGVSLLKLITSLPGEEQQQLLRKVTMGDYTTPSCPSCGTKMVKRATSKGRNVGNLFWGCANYPKCKNTLKAKST